MKLFLASEGKSSIRQIEEYVGGLSGKKIAYVPTAANGERWGSWQDSESLRMLQSLNTDIEIVQLEDYLSEDILSHIDGKDIIWFAGGMAGYLMYWIRRIKLDLHIGEILKNTVFVGSSAGSMIAGDTLDIAEWYPGDQEIGASIIPTLELVDFDIYPHFEESMLPIIKERFKGEKLYLLKNGEAIIFEDQKITIIGEERIITK